MKNSVQMAILLVLVIFQSCSSHLIYNMESCIIDRNYVCKDSLCKPGIILGEVEVSVLFNKFYFDNDKKIFFTSGKIVDAHTRENIPYVTVSLGKTIGDNVVIEKENISVTNKRGFFSANSLYDKESILIFHSCYSEAKLYRIGELDSIRK